VTDGEGSDDSSGDGSEALLGKAFGQGDGLTSTSSEKIINEIEQLEVKQEPDIYNEVTPELSPLPEAPQNKGFDPSPHPSPVPSPNPSPLTPDDELKIWEACCQTKPYPNPKSDNVRSSQKRALAIRQAYRAARTKEDLSALHRENGGEFSQDELTWVYNWLKIFFKTEFSHVQMTAKISQPGLL
jgi:type IV secretory pathway VirB10-like protein